MAGYSVTITLSDDSNNVVGEMTVPLDTLLEDTLQDDPFGDGGFGE